jgi:NAD(P)-dependent dehydrogenase (short-subunit alcohol dehydrogenase family)
MQGYAIITGANGQMGSYISECGMVPLCCCIETATYRLGDLATYPEKLLVSCDLMDLEGLHAAIAKANLEFGSAPSILIHTASVRSSDAQSIAESDPDMFQSVFSLNFTGTYNILRACLSHMRTAGFGRIVVFGSDVASTGLPNGAAYAAAKAAMVNLVKMPALENADANILSIACPRCPSTPVWKRISG